MEGTLFIVGGGLIKSSDEVFAALIQKAGGSDAKFAFIVSASGLDPDDTFREYRSDFVRLGAKEENCLLVPLYAPHVRDERGYNAFNGDADGLCEMLEGVTGVWFTGGDQYFTAKCFLREDGSDTRLLAKLRQIYAAGGVIGGSSAGAAIMSRVMIGSGNDRGVLSRSIAFGYDNYDAQCEEDDPCDPLTITQGLGFFPHGVVDQHFNKRPRLLRLIEACLSNAQGARIGYAVSEDTALVYHGGKFSVLGSAQVFIADCSAAQKTGNGCYSNVKLTVLQKGDEFDVFAQKAAFAPNAQPCAEDFGFYKDYLNGLITNSPDFDALMLRYYLRGQREDMYQSAERAMPYIKGAVVYEAHGAAYLVIPKYYRGSDSRGYAGAHTSLENVYLDIDTVKLSV